MMAGWGLGHRGGQEAGRHRGPEGVSKDTGSNLRPFSGQRWDKLGIKNMTDCLKQI